MTFDLITCCLCLALGLSAFIILFNNKKKSLHLPGPKGLPYIGNAFQMDSRPHITLSKWAKEYGNLYKIKIFGADILVVSGEDTIHEVLVQKSKDFADRPIIYRTHCVVPAEEQGISWAQYSESWIVRKKIMTRAMKTYGDGLKHIEAITLEVIDDLVTLWKSKKDEDISPKEDIFYIITNFMLILMCGFKMSHDDPKLQEIIYYNTRSEVLSPAKGIELDIFPWLRFFGHSFYKKLMGMKKYVKTTLWNIVKEINDNMDPENPTCLLHSLQLELKNCKDSTVLTQPIIVTLFAELIAAGTQTTSATFCCLIANLIVNQDAQDLLRSEIKKVIGDRKPTLQDRNQLPLVEAMILEVLRLASIVPINLPHTTTQDTSVGDVKVLKGTLVWVNNWAMHHDEAYWEEPWEFKPNRFLDENRQLVAPDHPNRKRLSSFGAGRRVCLGEALAKNRLFLIITCIIQNFQLLPSDSPPNCDPRAMETGIALFPPAYTIKIKPLM